MKAAATTQAEARRKVRVRMGPQPNRVGLTRVHIMNEIDASLQRLGLDHVDLYQIHGVDQVTPLE